MPWNLNLKVTVTLSLSLHLPKPGSPHCRKSALYSAQQRRCVNPGYHYHKRVFLPHLGRFLSGSVVPPLNKAKANGKPSQRTPRPPGLGHPAQDSQGPPAPSGGQ